MNMTGAEMRKIRTDRHLSQTEFGKKLGIEQTRISYYERQDRVPPNIAKQVTEFAACGTPKELKDPADLDMTKCESCRYWTAYPTKMCDYVSITGALRDCEPGAACTKYEKKEGKKDAAKGSTRAACGSDDHDVPVPREKVPLDTTDLASRPDPADHSIGAAGSHDADARNSKTLRLTTWQMAFIRDAAKGKIQEIAKRPLTQLSIRYLHKLTELYELCAIGEEADPQEVSRCDGNS